LCFFLARSRGPSSSPPPSLNGVYLTFFLSSPFAGAYALSTVEKKDQDLGQSPPFSSKDVFVSGAGTFLLPGSAARPEVGRVSEWQACWGPVQKVFVTFIPFTFAHLRLFPPLFRSRRVKSPLVHSPSVSPPRHQARPSHFPWWYFEKPTDFPYWKIFSEKRLFYRASPFFFSSLTLLFFFFSLFQRSPFFFGAFLNATSTWTAGGDFFSPLFLLPGPDPFSGSLILMQSGSLVTPFFSFPA